MTRATSFAVLFSMLAVGAQSQDLPAKGKGVYTAQKCAVCHAVAGVGNKKGALDSVGAKYSADELRRWITNAPEMSAKIKAERKPLMKAYTLAQADLDALVAYLQTLK